MALVGIDHVALGGANDDLAAVVSAIEADVRALRARFVSLGVPTHHLDTVLSQSAELSGQVLPALRSRQREAKRVATLPYSGALTEQLAAQDLSTGPQDASEGPTSFSEFTGGAPAPPVPQEFPPCEAPPAPEEPRLFSLGGLKKLGGDIVGGIKDGAKWVAGKVSEAWDTLVENVTKAWDAMAKWWEETSAKMGAWIDENLADVRQWIKENVIVLRVIAIILKVVGWILIAVGVVLLILSILASLTGIGALAGLPGAGVALTLIGVGSALVGAGDMVDLIADWGEGKIDGQDLVKGLAGEALLTAITSIIPMGFLGRIGKLIFKKMPDSWKKKIADFLERLFKKGGKARPGPGAMPGKDVPVKGGTPDNPRQYSYKNPGEKLRNEPKPLGDELDDIDADGTYPEGSREYLLAAYKRYLERKTTEGKPPQPWERWRNTAIANWGNKAKGEAYERAFWDDHGFRAQDGWKQNTDVTTPSGKTRNYDIVDEDNKLAYEFKSGGNPSKAQIAKDREMVQQEGWTVHYVLSDEPTQAYKDLLAQAGITWTVWKGVGTPVP